MLPVVQAKHTLRYARSNMGVYATRAFYTVFHKPLVNILIVSKQCAYGRTTSPRQAFLGIHLMQRTHLCISYRVEISMCPDPLFSLLSSSLPCSPLPFPPFSFLFLTFFAARVVEPIGHVQLSAGCFQTMMYAL